MIDAADIEKRIDHAIVAPTPIDMRLGGIALENLGQAMELAKLMAVSGIAVPKWLRNNPGGCMAIVSRALRWQMDPFAVAEKSYMAIGKGGVEHIGYEAQLVHAVITAHAPLKGRLRSEIIGTGDDRRCRVWGTFRGETKPHEYTSETLGKKIKDIGYNDKGQLKGSPMWLEDPEVQLTYSAVRQWCRLHSSETLLGVYTPDEVERSEPMPTNGLAQRLRDATLASGGARGFDAARVAKVIEGEANQEASDEHQPRDEQQFPMDDPNQRDRVADQKGSDTGRQKPEAPRKDATGKPAARKESAQGEIFPGDNRRAQAHQPQPKKGRR